MSSAFEAVVVVVVAAVEMLSVLRWVWRTPDINGSFLLRYNVMLYLGVDDYYRQCFSLSIRLTRMSFCLSLPGRSYDEDDDEDVLLDNWHFAAVVVAVAGGCNVELASMVPTESMLDLRLASSC